MKLEFTYTELNEFIKDFIEKKYNYPKIKIKKLPKISSFTSSSLIINDIELEYSVMGLLPVKGKFKLYINGIAFSKEKQLFFIKFDYELPLNVPDFVKNIIFSTINKNLDQKMYISEDKILIIFLNKILNINQLEFIEQITETHLIVLNDKLIIEII